jgi:4-hydroxy-tetrahydrodipicolinate reductase
VELVAEKLPNFDIEIVEQHHRWKVDAPSGTALTLAEHCAKGRGWNLKEVLVTGREGHTGPRKEREIGVFAVRGGDVVGRHRVGFYGMGEYLELSHTATSRETFAQGAIRGAKWLVNQPAGLYSISDMLGF